MDDRDTALALREKGRKFIEAGKKLLEAADVLDGGETPLFERTTQTNPTLPLSEAATTAMWVPANLGTRLDQITNLLRAHGPMKATDIMRELRIPRGSLYGALRDKSRFESNEETGLWSLRHQANAG